MSDDKIEGQTLTILTEIVAHDVATGVEIAKKLGFKMPEQYDVGLNVFYDWNIATGLGTRVRFRVRLGDAFDEAVTLVPHMDGRVPMATVAKMWEVVTERVRATAVHMANVWLAKHDEGKPNLKELKRALAMLNAAEKNPELAKQIEVDGANRAQKLHYKRVR